LARKLTVISPAIFATLESSVACRFQKSLSSRCQCGKNLLLEQRPGSAATWKSERIVKVLKLAVKATREMAAAG
jgi:hypothetical protein